MKFVMMMMILVVAASYAHGGKVVRQKRDLLSCATKATDVIKDCVAKFNDEMDLDDKVSKEIEQDTPSAVRCCYMAKFNWCVKSGLEDIGCGDSPSTLVAGLLSAPMAALKPKCTDYSYPSAKCIFFVWMYYIIAAIVVLLLIMLGCCLARCLCGRK